MRCRPWTTRDYDLLINRESEQSAVYHPEMGKGDVFVSSVDKEIPSYRP